MDIIPKPKAYTKFKETSDSMNEFVKSVALLLKILISIFDTDTINIKIRIFEFIIFK